MALSLSRQYRQRKQVGTLTRKTTVPASDALLLVATPLVNTAFLTFDQPIILAGFPGSWRLTGLGAFAVPFDDPITAATLVAANIVQVEIATSIIVFETVIIAPYDPAIRTKSGGFASPDAFTI